KRRGGSPTSASATVTSSAEIKEIDISTLPEQLQQMLQNLDVSNVAEIDVSEIMSKLAGNLAKMKPKVPEKARPEPKREPTRESYEYVKLVNGAPGCPVGSEILTFEECRDAILSLGQKPDPYWTNSFEGLPRHCSLRDRPGEVVGLERMHFNTANRGTGRDDLAPICRKQGGQPVKEETSSSKSNSRTGVVRDNSHVIQELNGKTQRRLLAKEKVFYLVYMKQGGLTYTDESMLLDIKDHFQQRLEERGISLDYLWLDVGVERQIRALLDPPTLPSAMLLQGGNQPKFMLAHHREEDEEALAVRDEEIRLLLNTLLGDETRFQRLHAKKLETSWAKKT
ncbi:NmrA-like family domain-containing protein 1, partial [Durusdinium trenchii]